MQSATALIRVLLNALEGLFAVGLAGSTAVLILSFVEDVKTVLS